MSSRNKIFPSRFDENVFAFIHKSLIIFLILHSGVNLIEYKQYGTTFGRASEAQDVG